MLNFNRKLIYAEGEGSSYVWVSDVDVPADAWSYVAFTLDAIGRVGYFYLNGVLADSIADLDIGPSHSGPLFIGAAGDGSEPFMGMIDDVTVTRRALTEQEISCREHLTHGIYFWRVEAEDASGNSSVSPTSAFGVYSPEIVLPATVFPVDAPGTALYEMIPTFTWSEWIGPGPFDTIYYRIHLGLDREFGFEAIFDSLMTTEFLWVDSLAFSKQYWWKVDGWAETDTGLITITSAVDSFWTWALGDLNTDHSVDVSDLTRMVSFMFAGGDPLSPPFIGDTDGSCTVDISDLTFIVEYFFQGGPAPRIGCE